jgi:alpha-mannosidase
LSATLINTASSPDPYPERGEHVIKLWVALEESDPKKLSEAAGDLCHPMSIVPGSRHKGPLPPVKELLRLDASSTVLSSAGLSADGSLLVRLYETAGKKDAVTIAAPLEIAGACLEDLDGRSGSGGNLSPKGNTVSFEIAPYKIQGLKLKLKG